jgi:hypothetical protein
MKTILNSVATYIKKYIIQWEFAISLCITILIIIICNINYKFIERYSNISITVMAIYFGFILVSYSTMFTFISSEVYYAFEALHKIKELNRPYRHTLILMSITIILGLLITSSYSRSDGCIFIFYIYMLFSIYSIFASISLTTNLLQVKKISESIKTQYRKSHEKND